MRFESIWRGLPPVTKNLIMINLIIWLFMMISANANPGLYEKIMRFGALHYFTAPDFNPAQLLLYMFMHSAKGLGHIFFNMFALFMFGNILERTLGSGRYLFYYLSCGIGAALVQEGMWALTWEHSLADIVSKQAFVPASVIMSEIDQALRTGMGMDVINQFLNALQTIGASGSIFGILLAFGMLFPNAPMYIMFIPVPIKAKWLVLGYGALEVLLGMSEAVGMSDGVAHFAHLGGMIFGFMMIWYWKKKGTLYRGGGFY